MATILVEVLPLVFRPRQDSPTTAVKALTKSLNDWVRRIAYWTVKWFVYAEQTYLTEAPVEGDEEQEPMEMAVRELQSFIS